jgi:hypothetical protein
VTADSDNVTVPTDPSVTFGVVHQARITAGISDCDGVTDVTDGMGMQAAISNDVVDAPPELDGIRSEQIGAGIRSGEKGPTEAASHAREPTETSKTPPKQPELWGANVANSDGYEEGVL